jgi:hypothetical protein
MALTPSTLATMAHKVKIMLAASSSVSQVILTVIAPHEMRVVAAL